ncbi:MAG: hypothetical protein RJB39_158 [Candidatus Parcubacteria bacterium]|jgi:cell division protein FtsI/penicillin-binding protein 2
MQTYISRARIISLLFICGGIFLITKLYILQVARHEVYRDLADRQYVKKNNVPEDRGSIFFTLKDGTAIPAATMKTYYTLYINAKSLDTQIKADKYTSIGGQVLSEVSAVLPDLEARLKKILDNTATSTSGQPLVQVNQMHEVAERISSTYTELYKNLDEAQVEQIQKLNFNFLGLVKDKKRYYPGGDLASHVIGLLGYKGDELAGRYGLEKFYQANLMRKESAYTNFFADIFSGAKKMISDTEKFEGDIYTTIEPVVQKELQKTISHIHQDQSSELTGAVVMDPYTGEILAMAEVPSFNPEQTKNVKDITVYNNDIVDSAHEMGSIIKPLTMAVGIDTGKVHAESTYTDEGFIKVRDRTMYNFDKKGRGTITMQTALSQSLNTGFVHVAQLVGNDAMTKYFYKFGLGEKTMIDLPDESAPLTQNLKKGDVEHATASFGQGIAMTPLGTIRALAVIANGGYLVQPHVVSKIKYSIGTEKTIEVSKFNKDDQILKDDTADEVRRMLVYNVDNTLLNGKGKNPRYSIAAKTGTAQIASPNGGYYQDRNIHTFIGFFPAYKPKVIVFIYTVWPKNAQFASESLAKSFLDLSSFLIQYYEIAPDR